jgi:MFS superfamily sulfate permease-like transporter
MIALPLALGFGVSSGMGARAGLVTAVIAGTIAAVFGGSRFQVSGPTGAMTVVLIPIIAAYGPGGVLVVGMIAGLLLVGLGLLGAGRFIRYVPVPVVEGFTVGIALIIALQQVPATLGIHTTSDKVLPQALNAIRTWANAPAAGPVIIAVSVVGVVLVLARLLPRLPAALIGLLVGVGINVVLGLSSPTIGRLPAGLPSPALPSINPSDLKSLLLPAVAVAALAALESLLSATVADSMTVGARHDSDRELVGQGLANLVVPFFGGIPATAAIARTAVNVRSGATSRLAATLHAVVLLAVVLVAAPWVSRIPLAALAGILVATAVQMIRISSLIPLLRATRADAAVLLITVVATIALDLVTAVIIGLVVAGFFALRQVAQAAFIENVPLDDAGHQTEEQELLDERIVAYRLDGPLFFAAAHDFLLGLVVVGDVRVVILRMSRVTTLDATGATVLGDTVKRLEGHGVTVLLSGVKAGHIQALRLLGAYDRLDAEQHVFAATPDAISHARLHVARTAHHT